MSRLLSFLAFAAMGTVAACSEDKATANAIPLPPSECGSLPPLAEVRPKLVAALDERSVGATVLEPKDAYLGQVPLSVGYALDGKNDDGSIVFRDGPLLLRSREEVEANEVLKNSSDQFDVDWSKDALLVLREHVREAIYRYVLSGTELVVVAAKATPCLAEEESASFFEPKDQGTRVLRVPNTTLTARMETIEMRYRMTYPSATGTCRRASDPVVTGGGQPSVVRGPDGIRLYFDGFSAMTGNVFFGESTDNGSHFVPNGWDDKHISSFAGRNSHYAGVYEPFVEHVGDGWRMTATTVDQDIVRDGARSTAVGLTGLVEMTSPDGLAWSDGKPLFPPTKDDERARTSPSRLVVGDEERLYFGGDGSIRVARRRGVGDFVEQEATVIVPSANPDAYDALGYGSPEVARVGQRLVLFATVHWGGLSVDNPWRTGIAYAISDDDGATFQPGPAPLVVPETEDEAGGMGSPSVLVDGNSVALFFSSVNRNHEPVVKRADCTLP
jgi:hypothetical protein